MCARCECAREDFNERHRNIKTEMVTNNTAKASSSVAVSAKSRGSRAMGNGSTVNSIGGGSIRAPGFRLGDGGGDHCDTVSSVSRNSIYKLKIDAMFDDTR